MRVLVACEFSGVVREAFRAKEHDAWSCDLLPTEIPGPHKIGDVRDHLPYGEAPWDLLVAFPPCTHLAVSGARWFKEKRVEQNRAVVFFERLVEANVPRIAIENPIGIMSTRYRKPDQIIQPWQFGHGETKATCLWLKNLPPLTPTNIVEGRTARVHREPPSPDRWKNRSRTLQGIAKRNGRSMGNPMTMPNPEAPQTERSGRCARCHELTVLERVPCETCEGDGQVARMSQTDNMDMDIYDCVDCGGTGYTNLTPCCGVGLLDEAGAVDAASDRQQEG